MLGGVVVALALKALAGGAFVVLFSLISAVLEPKGFAGLFSAAPAVAMASLLVTAFGSGTPRAVPDSVGMTAGSVAMVAYCAAAVLAVHRFRARLGSVLSWGAWGAVAGGAYLVFLR